MAFQNVQTGFISPLIYDMGSYRCLACTLLYLQRDCINGLVSGAMSNLMISFISRRTEVY